MKQVLDLFFHVLKSYRDNQNNKDFIQYREVLRRQIENLGVILHTAITIKVTFDVHLNDLIDTIGVLTQIFKKYSLKIIV